jgi:predicted lipoprotein with Yx(FWY)xxD motif
VKSCLLGTIKGGGARQVTYTGHPLYLYSGDTKPGETGSLNLKLFGAKWFVVNVAGAAITTP